MSLESLLADKQGGVAVAQEPAGGLAAFLARKQEIDEPSAPLAGHIERMVLGEPIEDWLPTEQAELAGDLFNSLDSPQDERERMSSAILLADMFDADIDTMRGMQPAMMKAIYGNELERVSKRFTANPMEGGFFEKSIESLRRGDTAAVNDQAIYSAVFEGVGSEGDALADRKRLQSFEEAVPIEGNKVSELFYASSRIVPAMARGYWGAIPTAFNGMLIGGGIGLIAGQAGPQALTLADEPGLISKGALTGTKVGFSVGSMVYWYKQGAGSMYANMIDKGHDPEVAKQVAGIAAIPYAIVEHSQVSKLIPGGRKNAEAIAAKVMVDVVKAAAIKYGETWTQEVFEEVVQEIITITAEKISGSLSGVTEQENVRELILNNSQRLWETTKGAAKAMALLPGPNVVLDIRSGRRSVVSQKKRAEINKKVDMFRQGVKIDLIEQGVAGKQADKILGLMVEGDNEAAQTEIDKINNNALRRAFNSAVTENPPTVTLPKVPVQAAPAAAREAELEPTQPVQPETPLVPTDIAPEAAEAKPEAVEGEVAAPAVVEPEIEVVPVSEPTEVVAKEKPPTKAPSVKPVLPTKIVSPGEAGPFKVTFKAAEGLPATRVIVDPQVRRSIQSAENKIADLKTKLRQAKADKKQAVVAATEKQIAKAETSIAKLKERQNIKLTDTIAKAKVKVVKLQEAVKFKDSLRRDAISMIQAIPKDLQPGFVKRASNVTTLKGIQRLANEIQGGLDRVEKQDSINKLKTAAKAIKPAKMLPEFAGTAQAIKDSLQIGKPQAEAVVKNSQVKAVAQQVLDNAGEDSVAAVQAQRVLDEVSQKTAKTFAINQLSIEAIDQITDTLTALRFQNEADTIAAKDETATEAVRRRKLITESIVKPPVVTESLGGKPLKKFKLVHDNLESVLDGVAGARPGTYALWLTRKNPTTQFIYDVLDAGVDKQILHSEKARDILRDILAKNDVAQKDILNWSMRPKDVSKVKKAFGIAPDPQVHTFTLKDNQGNSEQFEFTTNELMSIFMHSRNAHNLSVLLNDGIDRFIDGKKQKIRGLTVGIVDDMTDALTQQQKNVARQVGARLMDGLNKTEGNKTSVKLEFFEIFKVNRYWPASRSIIRGPRGKRPVGLTKTIESLGLLKERTGIGNPMKLSGFFETVHNINKNVSSYVGLAEPLREVKAVYTPDVIESLEDNGRAAESKVITQLIGRFEDPKVRTEGDIDSLVARMLGGFAKSQLFLKPRLAVRQQLSSLLISAYVDPKHMAEFKGIGTAELNAEIKALSPQFGTRADGLQFDRDTGDAFVENELMNYLTGDTSAIDKTAVPMKFFDNNAIVDIYRATKAEVIGAGVNVNTPEGKAILKDRFEWVARHTQPMWHPKDRSLLGSDPRPLVRSLTMFMSQREQMVRMVNNSIVDFANSEKTSQDAGRLGRSLGAVAMNMVLFTLYNIAWAKFIQKKERDVKDLGKAFLKDLLSLPFFGSYLATSFELVFSVLTDKPTFFQDFNKSPIESILGNILLVAIPNFARAGKHLVDGEKYQSGPRRGELKWKNELLVATDGLANAFAALRGIPFAGGKELIETFKAQFTEKE